MGVGLEHDSGKQVEKDNIMKLFLLSNELSFTFCHLNLFSIGGEGQLGESHFFPKLARTLNIYSLRSFKKQTGGS